MQIVGHKNQSARNNDKLEQKRELHKKEREEQCKDIKAVLIPEDQDKAKRVLSVEHTKELKRKMKAMSCLEEESRLSQLKKKKTSTGTGTSRPRRAQPERKKKDTLQERIVNPKFNVSKEFLS